MRNVVRASTRRDHTTTAMLLRRPFAAASCKAMNKAIDSTRVMETAATDEAAFSAVSLAGLESAPNIIRANFEMHRSHIAAFSFWVTMRLKVSRMNEAEGVKEN